MRERKKPSRFRRPALVALGLLLMGDTFYTWYYIRTLNLGIILPGILGIVFIGIALIPYVFKGSIIKSRFLRRALRWTVVAFLIFFLLVEALIIADPTLHRAELAGDADYLIVLGCGIWPDGNPTLALIYRLDKAVAYYRDHTKTKIIVSGGQGEDEPFPEALAMAAYLKDKGVPDSSILEETRSTSTMENFKFSRSLIADDRKEPIKAIFITNDFHVLRARILAKRNGFEAYAIPAPTPAIIILNSYMREFFAFVKSMLVDY